MMVAVIVLLSVLIVISLCNLACNAFFVIVTLKQRYRNVTCNASSVTDDQNGWKMDLGLFTRKEQNASSPVKRSKRWIEAKKSFANK